MAGVERIENVGSTSWAFTPDRLVRAGERLRALLRARLVDEVSGEPVRTPTRLSSPNPGLRVRLASDGLVGLVAEPAQVLPQLAATAVDLALDVRSEGFLPRTLAGTLGPIAGFPDDFAPLDLGDVALHRGGVAISGRVLQNQSPTPVPLAGAAIGIDAIWSHRPPPLWLPPALAEAPNVMAATPGLYAARAIGTALRERTMLLAAATKRLLEPLVAGQTRLILSDGDGLVAGALLALDIDDGERIELITIAAIAPSVAADEPARITLAHPAAHLHRDGVRCTVAAPQPPGNLAALGREALPGDGTLFLAAAPNLGSGDWIEIDDGVQAPEYQRVERYGAVSDADGYFRLPPIARVAIVRLLVQHAAVADGHPLVGIDSTREAAPLVLALE